MSDIDDFKRINDTYGHPTGDAALKAIAGVIRQIGRSVNFPARYGGDEFSVLLPETDKKAALLVAERFRNATTGLTLQTPEGHEASISVSIGVASFPEDASDAESLIRAADAALYQAKRLGKNRVAS
jgi:diguanylate cyclase (GGDEF)-like protein